MIKKNIYFIKYFLISFTFIVTVNIVQSYYDVKDFESYDYKSKQSDLNTLTHNMHKVSDALFENTINTRKVIEIFKDAHTSEGEKKNEIRGKLYALLKENYESMKIYGIQQLHFHLPNNESFLRFHKPCKFGDNLTAFRESVKYVNREHKPTNGFEEGKIFNGYRYVYPLFDKHNNYLGSVEVSSSLLNFKKMYESSKHKDVDFILKKDVVNGKVFESQLSNYTDYLSFDNFFIQTSLYNYDKNNPDLGIKNKILTKISQNTNLMKKINNIEELYLLRLDGFKVYSVVFVPLLNDFTQEKVGYTIFFNESDYFEKYLYSEIKDIILILVFSMLVGFVFQAYKRNALLEKETNKVLKKYQEEIDAQNKKLLKAQCISKMGFWELDIVNNKLYWSDEIFNIFEIDKEKFEASYDGFLNGIHPDDRELVNNAYSNSLKTKEDYSVIHRLLMKDGRIKWVREECQSEFDADGNPLISAGIVLDITELHLAQMKLIEQSYTDELTQLHNRKSYNERVEELLSLNKRYKTPCSIIMYDIDNFKKINDTYGHSVGDEVLVEMSRLIKKDLRESDYLFRVGGEEFVILLPQTKIEQAAVVAEKLRNSVEKDLKTIKGKTITISIGVTEINENDTEDTMYKRVDALLYRSKNSGKNMVSLS